MDPQVSGLHSFKSLVQTDGPSASSKPASSANPMLKKGLAGSKLKAPATNGSAASSSLSKATLGASSSSSGSGPAVSSTDHDRMIEEKKRAIEEKRKQREANRTGEQRGQCGGLAGWREHTRSGTQRFTNSSTARANATSHDSIHHHPSVVAGAAAGGSKANKLMDFQQKIKAEQEAKKMEKLKKEEQRLARVKEEEERRRAEKLQQKKALQVSS